MAIFEVQGPDGVTYEIDAPDEASALASFQSFAGSEDPLMAPTPMDTTDHAAAAREARSDLKSSGGALLRGFENGGTFGFADNLAGGRAAALEAMTLGNPADAYTKARDEHRGAYDQAREQHPNKVAAGNLAGAMAPALAAAPFTGGGSMLGTMGRGAVAGAVEGGLHGAGNANGEDVLGKTIRGGVIGGTVGAAAPPLIAGASMLGRAVRDPITGALGVANKSKANRAIANAMGSSKATPDAITEAIARAVKGGQPEFRMMDALGVAGQRQASGITRSGGDAATELAEFLEKRQLGQGERVGAFVEDAFGVGGTTADKTKAALTASRKSTADAAYDAARGNASPVDIRGALGVIDDRIGGMSGSGIAGDSIDGKLAGYRARLAGDGKGLGPDVSAAELSDFDRVLGLKQSVQDDIGAAVRAGRNNEARELGKLADELDSSLEASSDMFRTANDGFRDASRVIDSIDSGAAMSARGRAANNVSEFQSMNPEMQGAARVGYGDDILNRLERVTAPTANRAKPLQSFKRETEAGAMALDPKLYGERLARENDMWATQNRALGGSRTADNLADQDAISALAGEAMGAAKSAANLQFGDVAAKIARVIGPMAKGQNEATRQLVAQALMSSDPVKTLAPIIAQQAKTTSQRRMLEGLVRNAIRPITDAAGMPQSQQSQAPR